MEQKIQTPKLSKVNGRLMIHEQRESERRVRLGKTWQLRKKVQNLSNYHE